MGEVVGEGANVEVWSEWARAGERHGGPETSPLHSHRSSTYEFEPYGYISEY